MALFDAFLKLDGIKGESHDAKHKGELQLASFQWGVVQTGTQAFGGGGGAGRAAALDFHCSKAADAASPLLMVACATGQHFKEATLVVRKAGGEQLEYMKVKLTDVIIASFTASGGQVHEPDVLLKQLGGTNSVPAVQTSAAPVNHEMPVDQFSLNFARIEYAYQMQGPDGKPQGGPIMAGWDIKAHKKI